MHHKMTRQEAEMIVYVDFTRPDIEAECQRRGIKVTKDRSSMEQQLIEAMVKD